jgi:hypothetical protein
MKVFGKSCKEYIWPVKWYVADCVLIVVFQYDGMLLLLGYNDLPARATQWGWMIFVALALYTLVKKYGFDDFGVRNILFTGVVFAIIIHGLKAFVFRVFFFPYGPLAETWPTLLYKFFYGSALVMAVTAAVAMLFYSSKRGWLNK